MNADHGGEGTNESGMTRNDGLSTTIATLAFFFVTKPRRGEGEEKDGGGDTNTNM